MKQLEIILNKYFALISYLIFAILFCLIVYRAYFLSITYDEVWTFDLASQSIKDIATAERNFYSANNHILNSILIKPFLYLFGHHVWVLRMPNVLSYLLYFIGVFFLVKKISTNSIIKITGIILLCFNIYLLDFFSLSRGYGLANAFEMMSLTCLVFYFDKQKNIFLFTTYLFASLAIFSNFTWINFYLPLWFTMNVVIVYRMMIQNKFSIKKIIYINIIPLFFAIVCTILLYIPIQFLKKQDEFKWGANGWFDSFYTYCMNFNYDNSFIQGVLFEIIFILVFLVAAFIIFKLFKLKNEIPFGILFFTTLILTIISATIVQRNFMNVMYMDGRKATMYYALVSILIFSLLEYFSKIQNFKISILSLCISFFTVFHFINKIDSLSVREWWFDKSTNQVIDYIAKTKNYKTVAMNWEFESAFTYYNHFLYNNKFQVIKIKDTIPTENIDCYYIFPDWKNKLPNSFKENKLDYVDAILYEK